MDAKDILVIVGPVAGAAVGGTIAMMSAAFQVRRNITEQCFAAFIKFHTIISSVTAQYLPSTDEEGWHDAYLAKRRELEQVGDELIALTHLKLSADLAGRVQNVRVEFRTWYASYRIENNPSMPGPARAEASKTLNETQPAKILAMLDDLTREFRGQLHHILPR